jgi:hypothetical protein
MKLFRVLASGSVDVPIPIARISAILLPAALIQQAAGLGIWHGHLPNTLDLNSIISTACIAAAVVLLPLLWRGLLRPAIVALALCVAATSRCTPDIPGIRGADGQVSVIGVSLDWSATNFVAGAEIVLLVAIICGLVRYQRDGA